MSEDTNKNENVDNIPDNFDDNVSFTKLNEDVKDELSLAKESLMRATADFENIKKRLEREKGEAG